MEALDIKDVLLESYADKCRCCFRIISEQESLDISEETAKRFFELTQIHLISSDEFSKKICSFCENDLEVFSNFRQNLIAKQKKLYNASKELHQSQQNFKFPQDFAKLSIKTEFDEDYSIPEANCSTFVSIIDIKPEVFVSPVTKKKTSKNKEIEIDDEDYQKLRTEVKDLLKKKKEKYIACPQCFKVLHRHSLREHVSVVHFNQTKFECDRCEFKTSRRGSLMMHLKGIHNCAVDSKYNKESFKRQCNYCGAMIKNWRRHIMKVHMNIKNAFCDLCPYSAYFKYDLEQHMRVHVKKVTSKPQTYFCDACGLEFKKRFHLNAHFKAKHMTRERVHQCPVCEKLFLSANNLRIHRETHTSKNLPCEFCGKLFSCMNNLRTHLYLHSGQKFVCDYPNCEKKFYKRKRLHNHKKTHEGKKDIKCNLCDKSYFNQNDLRRHMVTIHEKLRFLCHVPGCSGDFSRRAYYRKHALSQHQNLGHDAFQELLKSIKKAQPYQKF